MSRIVLAASLFLLSSSKDIESDRSGALDGKFFFPMTKRLDNPEDRFYRTLPSALDKGGTNELNLLAGPVLYRRDLCRAFPKDCSLFCAQQFSKKLHDYFCTDKRDCYCINDDFETNPITDEYEKLFYLGPNMKCGNGQEEREASLYICQKILGQKAKVLRLENGCYCQITNANVKTEAANLDPEAFEIYLVPQRAPKKYPAKKHPRKMELSPKMDIYGPRVDNYPWDTPVTRPPAMEEPHQSTRKDFHPKGMPGALPLAKEKAQPHEMAGDIPPETEDTHPKKITVANPPKTKDAHPKGIPDDLPSGVSDDFQPKIPDGPQRGIPEGLQPGIPDGPQRGIPDDFPTETEKAQPKGITEALPLTNNNDLPLTTKDALPLTTQDTLPLTTKNDLPLTTKDAQIKGVPDGVPSETGNQSSRLTESQEGHVVKTEKDQVIQDPYYSRVSLVDTDCNGSAGNDHCAKACKIVFPKKVPFKNTFCTKSGHCFCHETVPLERSKLCPPPGQKCPREAKISKNACNFKDQGDTEACETSCFVDYKVHNHTCKSDGFCYCHIED